MTHLAQTNEFVDVTKYLGTEFNDWLIEKEGIITKDNFVTDFVPGYILTPREKNLDAFREGLTLNGKSFSLSSSS